MRERDVWGEPLSDDQAREVQRAIEEAIARRKVQGATAWVAEVEALWQAQLEEWRCYDQKNDQKRGEEP